MKTQLTRLSDFTLLLNSISTFTAIGTIMIPMAVLLAGCGPSGTPLDAETRLEIDTTASNQILYVRKEMDSICRDYERQHLKALVDSIKKVREEEIARQLKTIPR
jgi:hypothetical protein